jgi:hypothetical protein
MTILNYKYKKQTAKGIKYLLHGKENKGSSIKMDGILKMSTATSNQIKPMRAIFQI